MIKYILIYCYHDTHVEYFSDLDKLRVRFYELLNEYSNNSDFSMKVFKVSSIIDFI